MNDLIGRIIAGRYRIEAFLGKGGMAEVYKVWDQERSVHLAMKILHADLAEDKVFLRRFRREAQTLAKLQHPKIVCFYGLEQDDDLVYILMDYVEGTTLRTEIFQSKAPFSMERILEIMKPVCAALYYAHKSGFVHCDVKPANIMLHMNGTIYVSDFGIARMTEASTVTMVGAGTPAYMAPEQARGEDPVPQTDIYSLGVILFEMLTGGERPFTGENARTTGSTSEKVRWEQIRLAPPSPSKFTPSISSSVDNIVLKCLEKSPASRYLSTINLLNDLMRQVVQVNMPVQSEPLSTQPRKNEAQQLVLHPKEPADAPFNAIEQQHVVQSRSRSSTTASSTNFPAKDKKWIWVFTLITMFCLGIISIGVVIVGQIFTKSSLNSIPILTFTPTLIVTPLVTPLVTPIQTNAPLSSDTPMPMFASTSEPTAVPTIARLPQQWNGTYTYPSSGAKQNISLLIEKMNGTMFTGKMIWQSYGSRSRGAILKMNGEYVTDFGDDVEQVKWNNLDDYKNGDRSGTWLKWTETEIIDGGNYTVNGWYYAHIREDGTMLAVYFYNKDEVVADIGLFVLKQVTP